MGNLPTNGEVLMTATAIDPTCSACSGQLVALGPTGAEPLAKCEDCGGLHTLRPVYKGALPINLFKMQTERLDQLKRPLRYFDLEWLDGEGFHHWSHGWYDPDTLNVVQYG